MSNRVRDTRSASIPPRTATIIFGTPTAAPRAASQRVDPVSSNRR